MKKSFVILSCFCSLCLISCASKPDSVEENVIEAPEAEILETAEEELPVQKSGETEDESAEDEENEVSEDESAGASAAESAEILDEAEAAQEMDEELEEDSSLEEIEEPEVITLEPEEETEGDVEEAEPIEVETPPAIELTTENIPQEDELEALPEAEAEDTSVAEAENDNTDDIVSLESSDADDITNESIEDSAESEAVVEEIVPSRKVTLKKQEYVDVTYPGNGWVFMGLTDGSKDLSYFGRKLGTSDTKFTLQARTAGTKILHFYKNDALTNQYIDDYIEVEVLPEKGSNTTHIQAPEYKQPVPKKAKKMINSSSEKSEVTEAPVQIEPPAERDGRVSPPPVRKYEAIPVTPPASETENNVSDVSSKPDTNVLLKEAHLLYNEKEYKAALERINLFFEYATTKRDEGLFLKGQILEAKSEVHNIKAALESYTTLTKNYPASKYWDDANKRIIYLKRFYFGG